MKWFFLSIWDFIVFHTPFLLRRRTCEVPATEEPFVFYQNWLLQKIEPIINSEKMSDKEKIERLKKLIDNYDPLEY